VGTGKIGDNVAMLFYMDEVLSEGDLALMSRIAQQ